MAFVVFTGCGDGIARAYDAKSATLRRFYQGHEGAINCLVVVDDKLFTGSSDGTLRVWDAKDIRQIDALKLHVTNIHLFLDSDDMNVDEEPPPAPPTTVIDDGLANELERLENDEDNPDLIETPEDGIIDDDAPPPPPDDDVPDDEVPDETNQEEAIEESKTDEAPEEVLASG